ncbi:HK97 family phage prohead protease [Lentibacillus amyloliquefaciens]|uniref:Phage prohead protease n=1 Tax=Lentibacillus amyloliquefaciens TaxID=1472767 RepID=A0A0U4FIT0_9BACI|nr:HK97 family phage prohead protease [Lentibacillus amyloliquefaciens]ALX50461.1 phage prohead protease [Lentibacillus amyloliquefaciens]
MTIQTREVYFNSNLQTRETDDNEKVIEGYFIRFNEETELAPGMFEEINPTAVSRSLTNNDIYALFNHDSKSPLGRTGNGTLELRADNEGLWGKLRLNENDPEAMSVYAKISRNDISGCSFGFIPLDEDIQHRDDGTVKFIVKDADIKEVSAVTFPAYPTTSVQAREKDLEQHKKRLFEQRKKQLKERLEHE